LQTTSELFDETAGSCFVLMEVEITIFKKGQQ